MILLLLQSCLVFYCLIFSWLKIWRKMTDSKPGTKTPVEVTLLPSQEPSAASGNSGAPQPHPEDCSSSPPNPAQASEPAPLKDSRNAHHQKPSRPLPHHKPPRTPVASDSSSSADPAHDKDTGGSQDPDSNGLKAIRPKSSQAGALSKDEEKQAHLKRQLMTDFILGSFDDNSSDDDTGAFQHSARKGSRASLGAPSPDTALATSHLEAPTSVIR